MNLWAFAAVAADMISSCDAGPRDEGLPRAMLALTEIANNCGSWLTVPMSSRKNLQFKVIRVQTAGPVA